MENGLTPNDQRLILQQELADWKVARYRFEVRHRVAKTIGDPKEHLDNIRRDLERCEKAIDALEQELRGFDTEPAVP